MSTKKRRPGSSSALAGTKRSKQTTKIDFGKSKDDDYDISSDDEPEIYDGDDVSMNSSDESGGSDDDKEEEETLEAKKIRLARSYLDKVTSIQAKEEGSSSSSDDSDDEEDSEEEEEYDRVSDKLARKRLKRQGNLEQLLADKVNASISQMYDTAAKTTTTATNTYFTKEHADTWIKNKNVIYLRGHDLTVTCVTFASEDESSAFSGSKDNSIIMWDIERQQKKQIVCPLYKNTDMQHTRNSGEVLALAASNDGRYLACGGRDCLVKIYDIRSNTNIKTFIGHKGAVTSLCFRKHSNQLFSGSEDRCIRHYDIASGHTQTISSAGNSSSNSENNNGGSTAAGNNMIYVDTLYGHQGPITSMSCHLSQKPISTARDRTLRLWKLQDETHLIYRGLSTSTFADCSCIPKEDYFLTGHDNGDLYLWNSGKKKPISIVNHYDTPGNLYTSSEEDGDYYGENGDGKKNRTSGGIVSVATAPNSDLALTGSNNGELRMWKLDCSIEKKKREQHNNNKSVEKIQPLCKIPIHGFVNQMEISRKGKFAIAAVGQEHRLGRWERVAKAKNRFAIIKLRGNDDENNNDADE